MNKENAIKKINSIGNIGYIVSIIARCFLIIGLVGTLAVCIVLLVMPKDTFKLTLNSNANLGITIKNFNLEKFKEQLNSSDADISINGNNYYISDYESDVDYDEDDNYLKANYTAKETVITPKRIITVMIIIDVVLIINIIIFTFVAKLCKAIKNCKSPFEDGVIKGIERLAWSLIPWGFFNSIAESIKETAFTSKLSIQLGINLNIFIIILLLFGLAYIFKYGAILQTESDETL